VCAQEEEKPKLKLTEQQISAVMTQLIEVDKKVDKLRNDSIFGALQKLRVAVSSESEALKLYTECDELVNVKRKEMDRKQQERHEKELEKKLEKRSGDDNEGSVAAGIRMQIAYLILSLEAYDKDVKGMLGMMPKLNQFLADLKGMAPKLKGRAMNHITQVQGSPIVQAFELEKYISGKYWAGSPGRIGEIYDKCILPVYLENGKKDSFGELWDSRIALDMAFRKETMTEPEFLLWGKNEYYDSVWRKQRYLFDHGSDPTRALAEMLKILKEHCEHQSADRWLNEIREIVNQVKNETQVEGGEVKN
jgi:hypothetical protein